ncbi:hypothetical protein ABIB25_003955 [Nakamurella sp. UYEF19]|uniref:phosphotransferase n=1 Tax=Nakamurella sp. UYEF19 TaxID=1756392 RepID=UPI003390CD27
MSCPAVAAGWLGAKMGRYRIDPRHLYLTGVSMSGGGVVPYLHLHDRVPCVPEVFGFDEMGREILAHLPGEVVDVDESRLTTGQLRSLVEWTRRFHREVAGFRSDGPWRMPPIADATVTAHNDIPPYNVCFEGDELVGVFDWDLAGPSTPLLELAFIAWNCVPLWRDMGAEVAAARLHVIAETYGHYSALDILVAVPGRITRMLEWTPLAAATGDEGIARLLAAGNEPEQSRVALDALQQRIPAIVLAGNAAGWAGPTSSAG